MSFKAYSTQFKTVVVLQAKADNYPDIRVEEQKEEGKAQNEFDIFDDKKEIKNIEVNKMNKESIAITSMGILHTCDCKTTQFNSHLMPGQYDQTAFTVAQSKTLTFKVLDTVSLICGNGDGVTFCKENIQIAKVKAIKEYDNSIAFTSVVDATTREVTLTIPPG